MQRRYRLLIPAFIVFLTPFVLATAILVFWLGRSPIASFDYGDLTNGKYTNDYFGLSVDIPENWEASSNEDIDGGNSAALFGSSDSKKIEEGNTVPLLYMAQKQMTNLGYKTTFTLTTSYLGKEHPEIQSGEDILVHTRSLLENDRELHIVEDGLALHTIDGVRFHVLNSKRLSENNVYYIGIHRDFIISFTLSYVSRDEYDELMQVLEFIHFQQR